MTSEEIIRQLILSNLDKRINPETNDVEFILCWKWARLIYNGEKNEAKTLKDMIDWFYNKIMELSNEH